MIKLFYSLFSAGFISAQTYITADPFFRLIDEKSQFDSSASIQTSIFRPIFLTSDTVAFSINLRSENYFNNNSPNQENMDVRYFSKGISNFNSIQMAFNSPYLSFIIEPYISNNNFFPVEKVQRSNVFSKLNDAPLSTYKQFNSGFRNLSAFVHYKGLGFGVHNGNRWWGPGIHSTLQFTNNTVPISSQVIGTIQEIRFGKLGIYGFYSFSKINNNNSNPSYLTSLNGLISWYGPLIISAGFSRNYLTGGLPNSRWSESDAKKIVFEGVLTSNLMKYDYTVGGHDIWDQTLSGFISIILPKRSIKLYAEFGSNDNRMYGADLLSQPDHTLATVLGFRDYGIGKNKNWILGFEWTNLMLTYTIRHRGAGGTPAWYSRDVYNYSTYYDRRWAAHSGPDSDDWYLYGGYLSDKLMIVPALNYERHGIVSHRPAEVKVEFRLDTRYKIRDVWFGIYYEKQFEAFLGHPDYFYEDRFGNEIDASSGNLANTRRTNTLILSISKRLNF